MTRTRPRDWLLRDNRAALLVFAMVIAIDVMAIALHLYGRARDLDSFVYYVHLDHSYGEFFQYAKYIWIFGLIALYARENRSWRVAMWLPVFAFFFVDDALEVHEQLGRRLTGAVGFGPALGMRAQDVGEVVVLAAAGLVLAVPLVVGFVGADRRTRVIYAFFTGLVALLAFFGVVLDGIHMAFMDNHLLRETLALIEDGGEMVSVTLMVVFAVRLNLSGGLPGFPSAPEPAMGSAERGSDRRDAEP